jgi:hypothetical protein
MERRVSSATQERRAAEKPEAVGLPDREAGKRPASTETPAGVSDGGGEGERVGQSGGGRDAARWALVASVVEPGAGRTGAGVGAARPSLGAL